MIAPILRSRVIDTCGRIPVLGSLLRAGARQFEEGSVVTIRSGIGAGLTWCRHHRFVNSYWLGSYEIGVQLALQRLLRRGDVFYDVGANAGFFTVLAARLVGPRGLVFAFEPLPENVESVREQVELNRLSWCEVVPFAVGAHSGQSALSYVPGRSALAHLGPRGFESELEIPVRTVTLDEFTARNPFPSLVKIDVEGAEAEVLEGAVAAMERGAHLVLELHGPEIAAEVVKMLGRAGYVFESLNGSPATWPTEHTHLVARPSPA